LTCSFFFKSDQHFGQLGICRIVRQVVTLVLWEPDFTCLEHCFEASVISEVHGSESKVSTTFPSTTTACENDITTMFSAAMARLIVRMAER